MDGRATESRPAWYARWTNAVLALAFPPRCVHCGDFEEYVCRECLKELEALGSDVCPRCGAPSQARATAEEPVMHGASAPPAAMRSGDRRESADRCAVCLTAGFRFAGARSAFFYRGPAKSLVTACKSGNLRVAADVMAELAIEEFLGFAASAVGSAGEVMITWVPAHGAVERVRGYNQAEVLARGLARRAGGLPVQALCRKTRRTAHQRGLDRRARRLNLEGAFAPLDARLPGEVRAVMLVDDVYTTGVTSSEAAAVVRQAAGGLPVYSFTFCRTPGGSATTVD